MLGQLDESLSMRRRRLPVGRYICMQYGGALRHSALRCRLAGKRVWSTVQVACWSRIRTRQGVRPSVRPMWTGLGSKTDEVLGAAGTAYGAVRQ